MAENLPETAEQVNLDATAEPPTLEQVELAQAPAQPGSAEAAVGPVDTAAAGPGTQDADLSAPDAVAARTAPDVVAAPAAPVAAGEPGEKAKLSPEATAAAQAQVLADANGVTTEGLEAMRASEVAFSWQASEYVHHHKGIAWYGGFTAAVVVLVGAMFLLKDWATLVVVLVMAVAVLVYAHKPPRTLLYELSHDGITIDGRHFPFSEFRSFGVLPDVEWHTIDLDPSKRFNPRISLLFEDDDFEDIVGHLELHMPRIDRKPDLIERATRFLRF